MSHPEISIVVPVLNERGSLPHLHEELTEVMKSVGKGYEIIFVDDGSTDGSVEFARRLADEDPAFVLVELRRRFGKATALQAGFRMSKGDIVITLDADLQDDPKEISADELPEPVDRWRTSSGAFKLLQPTQCRRHGFGRRIAFLGIGRDRTSQHHFQPDRNAAVAGGNLSATQFKEFPQSLAAGRLHR